MSRNSLRWSSPSQRLLFLRRNKRSQSRHLFRNPSLLVTLFPRKPKTFNLLQKPRQRSRPRNSLSLILRLPRTYRVWLRARSPTRIKWLRPSVKLLRRLRRSTTNNRRKEVPLSLRLASQEWKSLLPNNQLYHQRRRRSNSKLNLLKPVARMKLSRKLTWRPRSRMLSKSKKKSRRHSINNTKKASLSSNNWSKRKRQLLNSHLMQRLTLWRQLYQEGLTSRSKTRPMVFLPTMEWFRLKAITLFLTRPKGTKRLPKMPRMSLQNQSKRPKRPSRKNPRLNSQNRRNQKL